MAPLTFNNLTSVLCIGCHADDIEIGCGGTILRLITQQPSLQVHWLVLSAEGQRADEAHRSAHRFLQGAADRQVMIHGFRDTLFPQDAEAIKTVFHKLSTQVQPDLIFTHRREDAHQDHRVAAELTWCSFRDNVILEYEIPKYEGDLGRPNLYVPLDPTTARRKIDMTVEAFPTQHSKPWFSSQTFEALMRLRAVECKAPGGFAEAFHARKLVM